MFDAWKLNFEASIPQLLKLTSLCCENTNYLRSLVSRLHSYRSTEFKTLNFCDLLLEIQVKILAFCGFAIVSCLPDAKLSFPHELVSSKKATTISSGGKSFHYAVRSEIAAMVSWNSLNFDDERRLQLLPQSARQLPAATYFPAVRILMTKGHLIFLRNLFWDHRCGIVIKSRKFFEEGRQTTQFGVAQRHRCVTKPLESPALVISQFPKHWMPKRNENLTFVNQ